MITYELYKMIQERRNHRFKFTFEDGYEYTGNKWLDEEQLIEQVAKHGKVTIGFNNDEQTDNGLVGTGELYPGEFESRHYEFEEDEK